MAALYQATPFSLEGYVEATTLPDRSTGVAVFAEALPEPLPAGVTRLTLTEFVNRRALIRQQALDWPVGDPDPAATRIRAIAQRQAGQLTKIESDELLLLLARRLLR